MKNLKKILVFLLVIGICLESARISAPVRAQAAVEPAKPTILLEAAGDGTAVKVTIEPTAYASGYAVYMKAPGAKKFSKVKTLKKNGNNTRTCTITKLKSGEYTVRVRAYAPDGKNKVWGEYSDDANVTLAQPAVVSDAESAQIREYVKKNYPELLDLADKGIIGFSAEHEKDTIKLGKWDLPEKVYNPDGGNYYNGDGEKDDLEWEVLEYSEDGKTALVISKYIIANRVYNDQFKKVTWKDSTLHKWLNEDFYKDAFTGGEKDLIEKSTVGDGQDYLYPLLKSELVKYSNSETADIADYSRIGCYVNGVPGAWWLRTNGVSYGDGDEDYDPLISDSRYKLVVYDNGEIEDEEESWDVNYPCGVRPVLRIRLTPELIEANRLSVGGYINIKEVFVTMGSYDLEDSNVRADGNREKLEWKILDYDKKAGSALLLSRYNIGWGSYNDSKTPVTWETCDLRKWLNVRFYGSSAFSDAERSAIRQVTVKNSGNDSFGTPAGNDTKDCLFLLSKSEVEKYLKPVENNKASFSRIAAGIGGISDYWWLRTSGFDESKDDKTSSASVNAMLVSDNGQLSETGSEVYDKNSIRPAFYLDLKGKGNPVASPVPGKPKVTAKASPDHTKIKVDIAATSYADGYYIYLKGPKDKDFGLVQTVNHVGNAAKSIYINGLEPGKYQVKVKAYYSFLDVRKDGKYSKVTKVTLKDIYDVADKDAKIAQTAESRYPRLKEMADKGLIGLSAEFGRETIRLGEWNESELVWQVLAYSDDGKSALVFARDIVDGQAYHYDPAAVFGVNTTWSECTLRNWLNETFYKGAFSTDEQKLIKQVKLKNEDNPIYNTDGGEDTEDRIFILSLSELEQYFSVKYEGKTNPELFCLDLEDDEALDWWLRTPGETNSEAVCVKNDGKILTEGFNADYGEGYMGVRPAFWISLTPEIIESNGLSAGKEGSAVITDVYVSLGSYDMVDSTGKTDGTKETVEWKVLEYDEENGRALLVSRYLLFNSSFNEQNWKKSSIRKTLNESFFNDAFTEDEKKLILKCTGKEGSGMVKGDKVFLLSNVDVFIYRDQFAGCVPIMMACYHDGNNANWWLRDKGLQSTEGPIWYWTGEKSGVRAALYINLK